MAEDGQKQAPQTARPAKRRRFYRPKTKPKATAEESAQENKQNASTPNAAQQAKQKAKAPQAKQNPKVPAATPQPKQKASAPAAEQQTKLHQQKPAAGKGHKTTAKTNGTFKSPRKQGAPRPRLSDINFKYLDRTEFKDIYALVAKAHSYFQTDKETCCTKFRIANEAIIARLVNDVQLTEAVAKKQCETNYFEQINMLSEAIPKEMLDNNIIAEMHNIRMIGNSFAHGDDKYNANSGSKTCLIAMDKICTWLVDFEPKYRSYLRRKQATPSTFTVIKNWFKGLFS